MLYLFQKKVGLPSCCLLGCDLAVMQCYSISLLLRTWTRAGLSLERGLTTIHTLPNLKLQAPKGKSKVET